MVEIEHSYECHGGAAELMECTAPEVLCEGPAGTGKTRAILHKIADLCEAYPGVRALIVRLTRTSCTESILVTLERDVIHGYPWIYRDVSRAMRDAYDCANGSRIVVGGLDHPERLYSTEWDIVYMAEGTEPGITEDAWEKFARAMRNKAIPRGIGGGPLQPDEAQATEPHPDTSQPTPAYWTQRIADCNPGAPGHWLNQRAKRGAMERIQSRHRDNPSVTQGYLDELAKLTGHRRARLYEGRWVAAEGGVYPEFSEERNVCEPFLLGWPSDWPLIVGYDSGYDHPCCVLWYGVDPTGQHHVIDEIHQSGMTLDDIGNTIMARMKGRNVVDWYADPRDVFKRTAHAQGRTIAEYMRDNFGLRFRPWPAASGQDVHNQVEHVRNLIRHPTEPLKVWSNCKKTIMEFQSWAYKRNTDGTMPAGDDAYEDRNNDAMDVVKGLVATRPVHQHQSIGSRA